MGGQPGKLVKIDDLFLFEFEQYESYYTPTVQWTGGNTLPGLLNTLGGSKFSFLNVLYQERFRGSSLPTQIGLLRARIVEKSRQYTSG